MDATVGGHVDGATTSPWGPRVVGMSVRDGVTAPTRYSFTVSNSTNVYEAQSRAGQPRPCSAHRRRLLVA